MTSRLLPLAALALACAALSTPALAAHAKPGLWSQTSNTKMDSQTEPPDTGQICLTPAQADAAPVVGRDCVQKNVVWKGNSVSGDTVCGGPVSGTGKFAFTYTGDSHYAGDYVFNGKAPQGGPFVMKTHYVNDWKSADCGKTRP